MQYNLFKTVFPALIPLDNSTKIVILLRRYGAEKEKNRTGGAGKESCQAVIQSAVRQIEYVALRGGSFGGDSRIRDIVARFGYNCADIVGVGILRNNPDIDNCEGQTEGSRLMISGG